ncbi:MAG: hypothetical protein AAFP26_06960 [Planctomycetota bacterium]
MQDPRPRQHPVASLVSSLGWALYLAVSWTWCIGMFLPSLLVRDAGQMGFVVFIVPNAIGAALVGWVLARRARSFFESKRPIILAFTGATIAFHGYWLAWRLSEPAFDNVWEFAGGMSVGALLIFCIVSLVGRAGGIAAACTLLFTLAAAFGIASYPVSAVLVGDSPLDILGLALVCALGFGLCPYLDLTFNRCAIESRRPRLAFTLGFVLFACVLLVATRGRAMLPAPASPVEIDIWTLAALIGGHFGAQSAFTIAAHSEALRTTGARPKWSAAWLAYVPIALVAGVGLGVFAISQQGLDVAGMAIGEVGYRAFLGLYGLVFPAWLILTIGNRPPLSKRTLAALAGVCVVAAPFFTYGFIWLNEVWLIPGVVIVLLGRLLADKPRTPAAPASAAA